MTYEVHAEKGKDVRAELARAVVESGWKLYELKDQRAEPGGYLPEAHDEGFERRANVEWSVVRVRCHLSMVRRRCQSERSEETRSALGSFFEETGQDSSLRSERKTGAGSDGQRTTDNGQRTIDLGKDI